MDLRIGITACSVACAFGFVAGTMLTSAGGESPPATLPESGECSRCAGVLVQGDAAGDRAAHVREISRAPITTSSAEEVRSLRAQIAQLAERDRRLSLAAPVSALAIALGLNDADVTDRLDRSGIIHTTEELVAAMDQMTPDAIIKAWKLEREYARALTAKRLECPVPWDGKHRTETAKFHYSVFVPFLLSTADDLSRALFDLGVPDHLISRFITRQRELAR